MDLPHDPNRYAVVFCFVLRSLRLLIERNAAIEAAQILGSGTRPETIRAKARKAWRQCGPEEDPYTWGYMGICLHSARKSGSVSGHTLA